MLLSDEQYRKVWDKVDDTLHFCPSVDTRITPFAIAAPYKVYDIRSSEETAPDDIEQLITQTFINCTSPGEQLYALDWQHSAFLFDPRIPVTQKSVYLGEHPFLPGHGLYAHFPCYYPDGDYYFFIDEQFRFGYLSHPWREEIWIFGECLIAEFDKVYEYFGWTVKEGL